ncbi:HU family DNA-binding protein [Epidermidibacterium keratini]|uniref:HU family DNA-binding protein n=1 Tax=Epidermidibacterium keratini TaxID=1891644 RepID=A0A7L4YTM1_9ACTN|nr:HU family DNA-binding protein [Epidermidibacterium keratini]
MNKSQLIEALGDRLDGDKRTAKAAVDELVDLVFRAVAKGESVSIAGFGVFEKRIRQPRTARNPATGEAIKLKKTSVPAFRPGTQFRGVVNGSVKLGAAPRPAKKAAATKATAAKKTTAAKSPAKKTTAKKTTAAKSPAKKTTAKKTTAAKAPAKKAAAKKTTAKKTTARKAPARKR